MASHRINLRGPWDFRWIPDDSLSSGFEPVQGTASMPQEWRSLFGERKGTAQFRRKFHRPTNLEPHESVIIVFTEVRGRGQVRLNDSPELDIESSGEPVEFDITTHLKPFNELTVTIGFDPFDAVGQPGGLFGVTALEIRSE